MILSTKFDKYRSLQVISRGTAGIIYSSTTSKNQKVIIKTLDKKLTSPIQLKRFKEEIQLSKILKHENIIKPIDYGYLDNGVPFYVMKFYQFTFRDILNRQDINLLLMSYLKLFDTLEYLALKNIVHRDIKPENILLNNHNEVVISDFGIALNQNKKNNKKYDLDLFNIKNNSLLRTYFSPEVIARSNNESTYSDLFSLGVILVEIQECFHCSRNVKIDEKALSKISFISDAMTKKSVKQRLSNIPLIKKRINELLKLF